jgi:hypothetical protein
VAKKKCFGMQQCRKKSWAKDEIRERVLFQLLLAAIVQYQSFYALFLSHFELTYNLSVACTIKVL